MRCGCLTRSCRASTRAESRRSPAIPASSSCTAMSATRRRSTTRCAASARSATWRRWSGSASTSTTRRCTRAATTWGPRCCSPRWPGRALTGSCWPRRWSSTARAAYSCAGHGPAATPPPRQAADLDAGRFEPRCPRCGEPLAPELVPEDAPLGPRNVYADTKLAQEHLSASWARSTGGQAVALRYHNVYGPGMPRDTPYAGVASFFRSCPGGRPRAAGLRGRRAATGLRPRPRRGRRHRRRA